jgi:hypothetical protein
MTKWNGKYNFFGEVHEMWTSAPSRDAAHQHFVQQIADRLGRRPGDIRRYFFDDWRYTLHGMPSEKKSPKA